MINAAFFIYYFFLSEMHFRKYALQHFQNGIALIIRVFRSSAAAHVYDNDLGRIENPRQGIFTKSPADYHFCRTVVKDISAACIFGENALIRSVQTVKDIRYPHLSAVSVTAHNKVEAVFAVQAHKVGTVGHKHRKNVVPRSLVTGFELVEGQ